MGRPDPSGIEVGSPAVEPGVADAGAEGCFFRDRGMPFVRDLSGIALKLGWRSGRVTVAGRDGRGSDTQGLQVEART
jgi:hypothetical protein